MQLTEKYVEEVNIILDEYSGMVMTGKDICFLQALITKRMEQLSKEMYNQGWKDSVTIF